MGVTFLVTVCRGRRNSTTADPAVKTGRLEDLAPTGQAIDHARERTVQPEPPAIAIDQLPGRPAPSARLSATFLPSQSITELRSWNHPARNVFCHRAAEAMRAGRPATSRYFYSVVCDAPPYSWTISVLSAPGAGCAPCTTVTKGPPLSRRPLFLRTVRDNPPIIRRVALDYPAVLPQSVSATRPGGFRTSHPAIRTGRFASGARSTREKFPPSCSNRHHWNVAVAVERLYCYCIRYFT
jgi:hypothetical protein